MLITTLDWNPKVNHPTLPDRWRDCSEGGISCFDDAVLIHNIGSTRRCAQTERSLHSYCVFGLSQSSLVETADELLCGICISLYIIVTLRGKRTYHLYTAKLILQFPPVDKWHVASEIWRLQPWQEVKATVFPQIIGICALNMRVLWNTHICITPGRIPYLSAYQKRVYESASTDIWDICVCIDIILNWESECVSGEFEHDHEHRPLSESVRVSSDIGR